MKKMISVVTSMACLLAAAPGTAAADDATKIKPSMTIIVGDKECTLGFVFADAQRKAKALTARHCGTTGAVVTTADGDTIGVIARLSPGESDIAEISVRSRNRVYADVDRIGPVTDVVGTQTLREVRPLMCKKGATTTLTCGPLVQVADSYFTFTARADHGDSGAPVYALTPQGSLLAAGILEGTDKKDTRNIIATAVAPFTQAWQLQVAQ